MARKLSGIWIPIGLDTQQIQQDIANLSKEMGVAAASMAQSFDRAINPQNLIRSFEALTNGLGNIRDAAKALEALRPMGNFEGALRYVTPELRNLAQTLGITEDAQKKLLQQMGQNLAINQQVTGLRQLERVMGTTREETLKLAKSLGMVVSDLTRKQYLGTQFRELSAIVPPLTAEFNRLARAAGELPTQTGLNAFRDTRSIQRAVDAFRRLHPNLQLTAQYYRQIAQAAGVATSQVAAYMRAQGSGGGRGILGALSPSNLTAGIQSAMGAMGVVGGMYGVVALSKSMVDAALKMDNLKLSFESIYGSAAKAATQLKYVKDVSDRLGLSFTSAASGAQKLFASIQSTEYAQDANKVFLAFSNAGAALKLTNDQMEGIFLAVSQSYAKGRVQAEELRSQLAERLPGAVALFAKSIGVTTRELDKMLQDGAVGLEHMGRFAEALQDKYGAAAAAASTGLQAELNRVSNAWFELKAAFVDSDALAGSVRGLGSALQWITRNGAGIATFVKEVGKFAAITVSVYALTRAFMSLRAAYMAFAATVKAEGAQVALMNLFGPGGIIAAASLAVGAIIYAFTSFNETLTENDKLIRKLSDQTYDLKAALTALGLTTQETAETMKAAELAEIERSLKQAQKNLEALLSHSTLDLPSGVMGLDEGDLENLGVRAIHELPNEFDKLFRDFQSRLSKDIGSGELGARFEASARDLLQKFVHGLKSNAPQDEIKAQFANLNLLVAQFQNELEGTQASDKAKDALEKVVNAMMNAAQGAFKATAALVQFKEANSDLAQSAGESSAAFDAIVKLTKGTDAAKLEKIGKDFETISQKLIVLSNNSESASYGLEQLNVSVDSSRAAALAYRQQIEQFEDALPLIASLAIKNKTSFDELAESVWSAGVEAGKTTEQLEKLMDVLRAKFNTQIGASIEKDLEMLAVKAQKATGTIADSTAFDLLSKYMGKSAKEGELWAAIQKRNVQGVIDAVKNEALTQEQVEKVFAGSDAFGSAKGAKAAATSRAKAAREAEREMSKYAKAIGEVEKKIAELQSKYDDDPSIKYWADVRGELAKLQNLLEKGTGTEAERARLQELMKDYERLAQLRATQMADEERRQKLISLPGKLGASWGNLSDINPSLNIEMQKNALNAEVVDKGEDWAKAMQDGLVTFEDTVRGMEALAEERNVKIAALDGNMVANFQLAMEEQYKETQNWQQTVANTFVSGLTTASNALSQFFLTGIQDTKALGEAFSSMVQGMIAELGQLFMKMIVINSLKKVFGDSDLFDFGSKSAKGNVFSGGNISKYSGTVVTQPTFFAGTHIKAYAKGGNLMGEAGPEGIFPLRRGPGGRLGVEGRMSSPTVEMAQQININVDNRTDAQVTAKKTTDSSGNVDIMLLIEKQIGDAMRRPGSAPFNALQSTWQGAPALASR